ncbi:MerR family transcriptional regulator [Latilactobacillus graminis]|uniref:Merr n=2 Tax=Latilactobacillus graminis TaxID=60519 RepID=A0AA89KW18_9LACO|nr:MerR family transcriptional regulator [Latilactobacillus graminis]KRM20550.1 merr [Latilactobacillus graminis DSM 20719]QFP80227.1 MerR family transcriptional regulator [Latilactobacillus graminis]
MYTIGQVAAMFDLPVSTIRYYDKAGLLPDIQRVSGIRQFSDNELEALRVIECLKKSGLEIKAIKQFMDWNQAGNETFGQRKTLFEKQMVAVEAEIASLEKVRAMLRYKQWYCTEAIKAGNEETVVAMVPDQMPTDIKQAYERSHI